MQKERLTPELQAYQEARLGYFKQNNPRQEKGGVVFAGDSLIEFFPIKKYLGRDLNLINRGIAGTDTAWLLQHLQEQVFDLKPSKVFLLIGTNDIGMGIPLPEILANIVEIISEIRSQSVETDIYLLSLLPVNQDPIFQERVKIRKNQIIEELNLSLSLLSSLTYVDLYSCLLENAQLGQEYTTDGLHLNQEGYRRISEELLHFL